MAATLADKWLAGERLYTDILEINPPFAIWMSAPPVLLAGLLGLRAEPVLDALVMALAAASVLVSWLLVRDGLDPFRRAWSPVAVFAVLVLLPAACFGEREHIALILFLPAMALAARRVAGGRANAATVAAIGLAAGCVVCIKPHFALSLAAVGIVAGWLARSWRVALAPEYFIAAACLCLYAASLYVLYPPFWTDMVPLVALLYLPARVPIPEMLNGGFPMLAGGLVIACALLVGKQPRALLAPRAALPCAAIAGFLLAALAQGKGWPYHFFPALALIVVLLLDAGLVRLAPPRGDGAGALPAFACAALFSAQFWLWFNSGIDMSVVREPLRAHGKHPRILAIASDFAIVFPALRAVEGVWVGRSVGHWVPLFTAGLAARPGFDRSLLPAYRKAEENDRRQLVKEIADGKPDVIMIERLPFDYLAWANRDPETAALLACFAPSGRYRVGQPDGPDGQGFDVELHGFRGCAPARPNTEGSRP